MSITYVSAQSSHGSSNSSTAVASFSYTAGTAISAGSTICVFCTAQADSNGNSFTWSVTDNAGNTYVGQSTNIQDFNTTSYAAFSVLSTAGSPTTFTLTTSGTFTFPTIVIDVFTGVNSVENVFTNSQDAPGTGTDVISSPSFSPAASGDAVWCGCANDTATVVAGTGFTQAQNDTTFVFAFSEYKLNAAAGAQNATFTDSTNGGTAANVYDTIGFSLIPAAAAATYIPFSRKKIYIPQRIIIRR